LVEEGGKGTTEGVGGDFLFDLGLVGAGFE